MKPDQCVSAKFPCYMVRKDENGNVSARVEAIRCDDLPDGEVLLRVAYSSLNYKDALAAQGHPGVVRSFPHVPGIDCAGTIVESASGEFRPGEEVLVTGYDLGAGRWGGYSEYVRVPAEWIVRMPHGLSAREAMTYGTAGFTAAQCVMAIVDRGIGEEQGPIVVTGATGGVGSIAVAILAKLGFHVTAVTGKENRHDWLRQLGAATILSRDDVCDTTDRPLLASRWAAAIDTVGGRPLTTIIRSMMHRGVVAACGLVAGADLPLSVYPFILRGTSLVGIDSAKCPRRERLNVWEKLAGPWRLDCLNTLANEVALDQLPLEIGRILAGEIVGRTLVTPTSQSPN